LNHKYNILKLLLVRKIVRCRIKLSEAGLKDGRIVRCQSNSAEKEGGERGGKKQQQCQ